MRRPVVLLAVAALVAGAVPVAQAGGARPCTGTRLPGGDWPTMTGPTWGSNAQPAEKRVTRANVAELELAWTSAPSGFQSIPVASGGCVYYTDRGRILALDLRTGRQVWATEEPLPATQYQPFAVAVANGRVHVNYDNDLAPRGAAFDADTGRLLWHSAPVTFDYPAWQLSSAVVHGDVRLLTTSGPDYDPAARPGFAVLDTRTGRTLAKRTTIPPADLARGYAGGGIWGTPVVDHTTGYAYAGTSNPYSKKKEHALDNAMVKIDLDPKRRTFGQIVASYKGDSDGLVPALYDAPPCQQLEDDEPGYLPSAPCAQQDIDFGNSPTLWKAADGTTLVSQLQKSGVMHTLRASDMALVWKTGPLGTHPMLTLTGGNHGNAATDGSRLYFMTNPGTVVALEAATGSVAWASAVAEPIASKNVVLAGGVVFVSDTAGVHGLDADTGERLWTYAGAPDGLNCFGEGAGLSFSGGHLLVSCSGTVAAFRLP
jgi:polyvinyl alcohol dehydrogenase (cytochrome)